MPITPRVTKQIVSKKSIFNTLFTRAKSILFFSAKKINRMALFHDRGLLKKKDIKLQKANNFILEQALISNKLFYLTESCTSYNFIAFSKTILNNEELIEILKLPYINIIISGALINVNDYGYVKVRFD